MLRLAQAASSEYFSTWGVPPNQRRTPGKLDGELNIVPFYGGWEYVFRPISETAAERIAWLMEGAVENGDHIGYSQCNSDFPREGVFDALFGMANPDTRKITSLVNCDCSSLAGACIYNSGEPRLYIPELRAMWTGIERELLTSSGAFIELTDPLLLELGTGLKRGDVLLKTGHTAVAIDTDDHRDTYPVVICDCAFSRIRRGPGIEYDTMATMPAGTILQAEGRAVASEGGIWYRVIFDGRTGYTSALYADTLPEGICTGDTWLRKEAGTRGQQIIVVPKGAMVYLTGKATTAWSFAVKRNWYECIYGGHRGWASSLNIKR
ncbi:MAG: hypothetical protein IJR95_04620 [Lachnospiraceae bacterium]|nr:hypothetical protein [Lachnospiraceae bacterium]